MEFRLLRADEIDIRVCSQFDSGATLLLYKDARVDMNILDEKVAPENWQRKHYECKGNLFCSVGIKCGDAWVWKDDAGAESNTEKEKGEASDSFKRACVNWGIGRELYTSPDFIFVKKADIEYKEKAGKPYVSDKFRVDRIVYFENRITGLSIKNKTGKVVYSHGLGCVKPEEKPEEKPDPAFKQAVEKYISIVQANELVLMATEKWGENAKKCFAEHTGYVKTSMIPADKFEEVKKTINNAPPY